MRWCSKENLSLRRFAVPMALGAAFLFSSAAVAGPANAAANSTGAATPSNYFQPGIQRGVAFCKKLQNGTLHASAGANGFCFGPQQNGQAGNAAVFGGLPAVTEYGNVDAANPQEDIAPNGTVAYGQSETSTAAVGNDVMEAWNDSTGFFAACPSPGNKEELTGIGFSSNSGRTFTDLGAPPNRGCAYRRLSGDPSVEAWAPGGFATFYVSSIYAGAAAINDIAINACQAVGTSVSCGQPVIAASSQDCFGTSFCGFLDKEFMSIDPVRKKLYISYTEFGVSSTTFDNIELAVCDISSPMKPVCNPGYHALKTGPYLVVHQTPATSCAENEGAYPAVDVKTGDVYVAYEHNWASNFSCQEQVGEVLNYIPHSCLVSGPHSPCGGSGKPIASLFQPIVSIDSAFIPGYSRFPMNDFPRIAVSNPYNTVSVVWNDGRYHPYGDILMQSYNLMSMSPVQGTPTVVNSNTSGWKFLPAVRNANAQGHLNVSFYSRDRGDTAITDVMAALSLSPRATTTNANVRITTDASDWLAVSSDINPNFGDYTDNYVRATSVAPYTNSDLYVAWSDGRIGDPQPYNAATSTH